MMPPRFVTLKELSQRTGLSQSVIEFYRQCGVIPGPDAQSGKYDWKAVDIALDRHSGITQPQSSSGANEYEKWSRENSR